MVEGTRPLTGPALTNDLCGQNVKVKVNLFISALAKTSVVFGWRRDKQVGYRRDKEVDFNILTALKGWVGHAP